MGRERVRVTHGTQEHGRDIVFYGPGGLGTTLYACVVKNDRITGEAGSSQSARTVIDQAKEAFQYPYVSPETGQEEQVSQVFVLSPYDVTPTAIDSIRAQLKGFGAIEFYCGSALLDLFSKHWQSFFVESNVLASYLTALRKGLQDDAVLLRIILQKPGVLADVPADFERMYVPQDFGQTVCKVSLGREIKAAFELQSGNIKLDDINSFISRANWILRLLEYATDSANPALRTLASPHVRGAIDALSVALHNEWQRAFQEYAAEARKEFERTFDKSLKKKHVAPAPIRQQDVALPLEQERSRVAELARVVDEFRQRLCSVLHEECVKVNQLTSRNYEQHEWLASPELRAYCGLLDISEAAPEAISFGSKLKEVKFNGSFTDTDVPMILVSGPAGFGKTSFCRSQALSNAEALLANSGHALPVVVPLHKFSGGIPATVEEAFFDSPELRGLLADPPPRTSLRLFLDGLDAVPNVAQQRKIIELARQAASAPVAFHVIVTARDHIVGPWLNDVPRLNVLPLTDAQQLALAEHWLVTHEAAEAFFEHLQAVSPLRPLMEVPLLATLVLAVYKKQGYLPPNRTALYDLFIELLCGGWDTAKEIQRHDRFGIHDKRLILVELAGRNQLNRLRDASDSDFRESIKRSLKGLLPHADDLLTELRHDGLLVTTAAGVRFRHLSFQEYLAAEFLHGDQTGQRAKPVLRDFFGGDDWWREVLVFHVTRTSNPTNMEEWLIKLAASAASSLDSSYVLSRELDRRLNFLRKALRDAFPSYASQYPLDGIVTESVQRGSQVRVTPDACRGPG